MLWQPVIEFWFRELSPEQWWIKDPALDAEIRQRFGELLEVAKQGHLRTWHDQPRGRLAEIIVLDQFSRNIYRDQPEAFAADDLALERCLAAIAHKDDRSLTKTERAFLYMPLMHSEEEEMHVLAIELFKLLDNDNALNFEYQHKAIIDRFGRYPHRNAILGRTSTPEELAFLTQPNSAF